MTSYPKYELNLHGYHMNEALNIFLTFYNNQISMDKKDCFRLIHGYGSSGQGGKIRVRLRQFLKEHSECVSYKTGEEIENNPGATWIYPKSILPSFENLLESKILDFCSSPKTQKKIAGQFRVYGDQQVSQAIKNLIKQNLLSMIWKGKHKCFIHSSS